MTEVESHSFGKDISFCYILDMINYDDLISEKTAHYKGGAKECFCPILGEHVIFNSKGLRHFKYDGSGHARSKKEHMYRMGLVPLIKPVIQNATKISKYTPPTYVKSLGKLVEYWELKEVVGKQKTTVTVILRRIGTGNITFYSVWKKADSKPHQTTKKIVSKH